MKQGLFNKEKEALQFIRKAESLAMRMSDKGFHVAFSGGKDSQVLLALMEMSGVKHHAEMQVTTVDSPNIMKFVRKYYPQVHLNLPQMNMRKLIVHKKMLPTRQARFCCAYLKEQAGAGTVTCIGIRKAESAKRAKRHPIEVIGQRVGYEIINGKLHESNNWGGNYLMLKKIQRFIVSTEKIKLLLLRFSIGRIRMFGILFIITIYHIATYTIKAFIASGVCFVLWRASRKNGVNLNYSHFSLNVFTSGQSVNLWQWVIITILKVRNNVLNGGFQMKIPLNGLTNNNNRIFLIYENCKY